MTEETKSKLLQCLNNTSFPKNTGRANVSGRDEELTARYSINYKYGKKIMGNPCQSITLGFIRPRHKKKTDPRELSCITLKRKELYELVKQYIHELNPEFEYTTICVNKDLVCQKHKDGGNSGSSLIIGLGDYEGGNLFLDGVKHSIKDNPIIFEGWKQEHWNDEITSGTKYSMIYYVGG